MSSPNQPYNFGSVQGAIAKAGKWVGSKLESAQKSAGKDEAFHKDLYKMTFAHTLKGEAHKQALEAEAEHHKTLLSHNAASASQMSSMAAPGSRVKMSRSGYEFQTSGEAPKTSKKQPTKSSKSLKPSTPIKQSAPAPKNPKGNLARRSQMGRAMTKKGL